MFLGTVVNALAVACGSLAGIFLKKSFPENIKEIIFQGLGLSTLTIGILMVIKTENVLILVFSVLIGGIAGELIRLQTHFDNLGALLKKRLKSGNDRFTEGLITAFLVFCVGSMTIMGCIEEGIRNDHTLLFAKSILDGFASIALAATYGSGVFFSVFGILIYQGLLTLLSAWAQSFFSQTVISQLTAMGGILIIGIGFNLLQIKKINTGNLMPGLVVVVILTKIFMK